MSSVDVMVICHDYARFLRQCVESVLAQSHRELRVLILDDASGDDTPAIAVALAAGDQRVEVLRHPVNRGHIATFNEAIDLGRADYLLILSADDFLLPGALARAVAVLDANPGVGLAHGRWLVYQDGDPPPRGAADERPPRLEGSRFIKQLARRNHVGTATAVVRRTAQRRVGHYHPALPHSADLEMWLRFALDGAVAYIFQPQAAWRRHGENMSGGYDDLADLEQCEAAFRPHLAAIGRRGGRRLLAQVRRRLAARQRRVTWLLLRQGRRGAALRLGRRAIGGSLVAWWLQLSSRRATD